MLTLPGRRNINKEPSLACLDSHCRPSLPACLADRGELLPAGGNLPGEIVSDRRRFLGTAGAAAVAIGAAQFGLAGCTSPQTSAARGAGAAGRAAVSPGKTSFGPVRHAKAGVLNVGFVEAGPADGRPVVLMHGFPYDIHSYVEVAPLLAAKGYRVIVPYFRGYGTTTFLSSATPRK